MFAVDDDAGAVFAHLGRVEGSARGLKLQGAIRAHDDDGASMQRPRWPSISEFDVGVVDEAIGDDPIEAFVAQHIGARDVEILGRRKRQHPDGFFEVLAGNFVVEGTYARSPDQRPQR